MVVFMDGEGNIKTYEEGREDAAREIVDLIKCITKFNEVELEILKYTIEARFGLLKKEDIGKHHGRGFSMAAREN